MYHCQGSHQRIRLDVEMFLGDAGWSGTVSQVGVRELSPFRVPPAVAC
jgi:hypothetical protein